MVHCRKKILFVGSRLGQHQQGNYLFWVFYPSVKTIFCARRHCQRVEKQIGSVRHTHISSQPVIFLSYLFGPCYPVMSSGSATVKSHLNKGKQGEKKIGSVRHTHVSSQPVILLSYLFRTLLSCCPFLD